MNNKEKRVPFAGLIANGAFFFARFLLLLLCDGFCIMWIQCAAVTAKMLVIVHNMKGKKKMNIQWGTLYLMNCVDITLLCVFKKSLSNIYVTFFFE